MAIVALSRAAAADMHPTVGLRAGVQYTDVYSEIIEGSKRSSGEPSGSGLATELEVGARLHREWSVAAFADYARFEATLWYEYPTAFHRPYESRFQTLMIGARATWQPIRRLFVATGFARVALWEHARPLSEQGRAFDSDARAYALQLTLGTELARIHRWRLQLSVGVAIDPLPDRDQDGLELYVPAFVGVTWD